MRRHRVRPFLLLLALFTLLVHPDRAHAQIFETFGIRAQGMGGAFVALADDATASWWNPAGLGAGSLFSGILENTQSDSPDMRSRALAVAVPSLALSYYRLPLSGIQPLGSTELTLQDRKDLGDLSSFGATVGQSIGSHFVVATTLKLLRGNGQTHGDFDAGAILRFGYARLGAVVKNVTEPTFGSGLDSVGLQRQARIGGALTSSASSSSKLSVTVDADLTRIGTIAGDERHLAAGAEFGAPNGKITVRGGLAVNTVGDARRSASAGLSLTLRKGTYVDAQVTGGSDDTRRGWGAGLRVAY